MFKDSLDGQTFSCDHTNDNSICDKCLGRTGLLEQIINKSLKKFDEEINTRKIKILNITDEKERKIRLDEHKRVGSMSRHFLSTQIRKAYEAGVKETKKKLTLNEMRVSPSDKNWSKNRNTGYNWAVQDLENLKKEI